MFWEEVRSNMQNQDAAIKKLETQIGYLFKQVPSHNLCNNTDSHPRKECQAKGLMEIPKNSQEKNSDERKEEWVEVQIPIPNSQQKGEMLKPDVPKALYPQQLKKKGMTTNS